MELFAYAYLGMCVSYKNEGKGKGVRRKGDHKNDLRKNGPYNS